jgi:hypothetical protein
MEIPTAPNRRSTCYQTACKLASLEPSYRIQACPTRGSWRTQIFHAWQNEGESSSISQSRYRKYGNQIYCVLLKCRFLGSLVFFCFNFYFFIIHMCIQCLGHFSHLRQPPPLPPTPPPPFPPHPLDTWQKLFCPYL